MKASNYPGILLLIVLASCQPKTSSPLREALTFYVSFENGTTADVALGDDQMYTADGSYVDMKRVLEGRSACITRTIAL